MGHWGQNLKNSCLGDKKMPKLSDHICYRSGYKYQLYSPYSHNIDIMQAEDYEDSFFRWNGIFLTIKAGYAWDGPSGLTWDTKSFMRGSLVHDAMYQLMRMDVMPVEYRLSADELLREICLEDGMWSFRANYVFRAVRRCGAQYTVASGLKSILCAP